MDVLVKVLLITRSLHKSNKSLFLFSAISLSKFCVSIELFVCLAMFCLNDLALLLWTSALHWKDLLPLTKSMSDDTSDEWDAFFVQIFLAWRIRISSTQFFHTSQSSYTNIKINLNLHMQYNPINYFVQTWRLMKPPISKNITRLVQYTTLRMNRLARMYTRNLTRFNGTIRLSSRETWVGCSLFQQRSFDGGRQKISVATMNFVSVRAINF